MRLLHCLLALCLAGAVVQGFPLSQLNHADATWKQGDQGDIGEMGAGEQAQLQGEWAAAAKGYNPAAAPMSADAQWSQMVKSETPEQLAAISASAEGQQLPVQDHRIGTVADVKAPSISAQEATRELTVEEEKQLNAARAQLAADKSEETKTESKIAGLKLVDAEAETMDKLDITSSRDEYERDEAKVGKDNKVLQVDKMNTMVKKMAVGVPEVGKVSRDELNRMGLEGSGFRGGHN